MASYTNSYSPDYTGSEVSERSNQQVSDEFGRVAEGISAVGSSVSSINAIPIINGGVLHPLVSLSGGSPLSIDTGLGRDWVGYIICGKDGPARVFADFANRSELVLEAGTGVDIILWVF